MDKKQLLRNSLAKIMVGHKSEIDSTVQQHPMPVTTRKPDGSPVTELDLALSELIESKMQEHFPNYTFYSEEKYSTWKFPLLALDPLDGTREYVAGNNEWALSIGIFTDENLTGEGWIYNPKTKECFDQGELIPFVDKEKYCGEVSRSEWNYGLFNKKDSSKFSVVPMGSIAYKLGRLSAGKCDFVVSLRPKNIWDIAGGTILCQEAGFKFYSEGKEVTKVQKLYKAPLIWCHEELFSELSKLFA